MGLSLFIDVSIWAKVLSQHPKTLEQKIGYIVTSIPFAVDAEISLSKLLYLGIPSILTLVFF